MIGSVFLTFRHLEYMFSNSFIPILGWAINQLWVQTIQERCQLVSHVFQNFIIISLSFFLLMLLFIWSCVSFIWFKCNALVHNKIFLWRSISRGFVHDFDKADGFFSLENTEVMADLCCSSSQTLGWDPILNIFAVMMTCVKLSIVY